MTIGEAATARFFQAFGRYPSELELADYLLEGVLDYYGGLIQFGRLDANVTADRIVNAAQRLRQLPRQLPSFRR